MARPATLAAPGPLQGQPGAGGGRVTALPPRRRVVLSYGMGADSTALLLRWVHEPATRPCALADLVVITAMTGDEWPVTGYLVTRHLLPLLREHGIRWVQLARAGAAQADGVTVLDDSRSPARVFLDGDWKLSDEMLEAGTVPQVAGSRKCSVKAKGWALDTFLAAEMTTVPAGWLDWAQRWRKLSTHEPGTLRSMFSVILVAGRWAAEKHPEAVNPDAWTRDIAAEYVANTMHAVVGQWAGPNRNHTRHGQELSAGGKAQRIDAVRSFFTDLIEWEWIKAKFDPRRVLSLPLPVRAGLGPNPRIIDDASWAKLMAAGLTLNIEDLTPYGTPRARQAGVHATYYPVEIIRALVGVWLFGGCRIDEIRRLELDCLTWDEGTDDQTGEAYPVCLLRVAQNKTSGPFSKPVDPVAGQLIDAWKLVRPPQPDITDRKTGRRRQHLFTWRGQLIGPAYLNEKIIPALCRKAGIPESDSRGALTSHRARATIATQLLNAKEPLTLPDLQQWLGHKHPSSTRHYAAILQRTLTAAYRKADYFARNVRTIQVLIDRETVMTGAAANGQPWKYYDLGDGYCSYDFFAKCPHRLACARCPFYVPKHSSSGQLLAVKDGVQHMLEQLDLTDEERTALEGDLDALTSLAERLSSVPTPAGPTPEQLGTDHAFVALTTLTDTLKRPET